MTNWDKLEEQWAAYTRALLGDGAAPAPDWHFHFPDPGK